jgi:hypothetical protein
LAVDCERCAREELEYQRQCENGANGRADRELPLLRASTLNWPTTEIVSTAEAELNALGGLTRGKSDKMKFMSASSMKRVLATLLQATPALHTSDTNSGALVHFWGNGGNYLLAKKKPPAAC